MAEVAFSPPMITLRGPGNEFWSKQLATEYDVSKKNKVRQLREYANYDVDAVHSVVDAGLVAQVAFVQDGKAAVVPMIYGRDGERLFLHGARKARVIRMLEENDEACVNITLVDGLVLARSAFNSSFQYRSATLFGKPTLVENHDDKIAAMHIISEHVMPGRWDELRAPLENEVKMTGVIAFDIEHASAKISASGPNDEDFDYDTPIWAGVLPLRSQFTDLVDGDRLVPGVEASEIVRALQGRVV